MGSEQSSQNVKGKDVGSKGYKLRREKTLPPPSTATGDGEDAERSVSPELSVCSDSDLPYISYTVNRPIGDSPKMGAKNIVSLQRGKSFGSSVGNSPVRNRRPVPGRKPSGSKPIHDIVVVKPGKEPESRDKDPQLQKLNNIPMFLPIMRGTLNLPGMRDPEVLEKLDPQDFLALCKRLQAYMALCADNVASSPNQISARIREIDLELCRLVASLGERQKQVTKAAEQISKIGELSRQLNRCHTQLNATLELMEDLNNGLPPESRLEPFVWTTG